MPRDPITISPQSGPQYRFLASQAEIAVYGGAAGSGKSYALLLEPLRNYNNPLVKTVIFRRTAVQVRNAGSLWDQSLALYSQLGAIPRQASLEWTFPSGMTIKFSHLETEADIYSWQGSQITLVCFDELVHFSEKMFWYLLSRARGMSGVPGYIRATCNPDCDSWVRQLIDWWIGPDGLPSKERSGVLRWFIRRDDTIIWADTKQELLDRFGKDELPKSFTFIGAKVFDNRILMDKDPAYLANLKALSRVDRERLLEGNWNVRPSAGMIFRREWFKIVDRVSEGWSQAVRFWDRAATKPSEVNKSPDWTRGLLLFKYPNNTYCVVDLKSAQDTPGQIETLIRNVAGHDGYAIRIKAQQDPGSAGVGEAEHFVRMLTGFDVRTEVMTKDKLTRAKPVSAQVEAGNFSVMRAPWNEEFFQELENFPDGPHDDIVDVLSGAFNDLSQAPSLFDVL